MVGSVLLERMRAEKDFDLFEPHFFSTSQAGLEGPDLGKGSTPDHNIHPPAQVPGRLKHPYLFYRLEPDKFHFRNR